MADDQRLSADPVRMAVAEWIALTFHHATSNTNPISFGGNTMRLADSLLDRLESLGYEVTLAHGYERLNDGGES